MCAAGSSPRHGRTTRGPEYSTPAVHVSPHDDLLNRRAWATSGPRPRRRGGSHGRVLRGRRRRSSSDGQVVRAAGANARSMSAKSTTQPDSSTTSPLDGTATRNECPCKRAHLCSGGTFGPVRRPRRELLEHVHHGIPRYLWVCRLSRHCGCARQYSIARGCARRDAALHRLQEEVGRNRGPRTAREHRRLARLHQLELVAARHDHIGAGLRLMHTSRCRGARAPCRSVSMAISNSCACNASSAASSSCNNGRHQCTRRNASHAHCRRCGRSSIAPVNGHRQDIGPLRSPYRRTGTRGRPMFLAPVQRLQTGESDTNTAGRPGVRAFALQRREDLLHGHSPLRRVPRGSSIPASANPFAAQPARVARAARRGVV